MRLTLIGYRLGEAGGVTAYDQSVVTVTPVDTSIVYSNKAVTLTAALNRDYKVVCWQKFDVDPTIRTDADPIGKFGEKSETVSVDFNPNVVWMYVTVVVEYDPVRTVKASVSSFAKDRGTVSVSPEKASYLKDDVVTLTAEPAEGYSFVRWSDGNADHERTLTVDDDVDLKAYIEPISSKVTFSSGVGAVLDVTSKRVSYDSAYGELPVPTRTGAQFSGWADDEKRTVTEKTTVNRIADHTLYASWSDLLYKIDWDFTGRGNGKVEGTGTYAYGSQPTLKAVPYEGSTFTGWTDGVTQNPRRITVLSNALYIAAFDVATYDVTFTYRDVAGDLVTIGPTTVEHGGKVDPPSKDVVDSWPEHTFKTWSTEEYKKVTRNLAVEAIYDVETYSVAFAYHDWQGNCVTTMPQNVVSGGKANPPSKDVVDNREGYTFKGWDPDYNVIRGDTLCKAIYTTNTYEVKFTYRGSDGEPREQVEMVQHGGMVQAVPETAVVDGWPGHRFLGWSNDDYLRPITGKLEVFARYEGYCEIDYRDALGTNLVEEVKDPKDWTNLRPVAELKKVEGYTFEKTGYKFGGWATNETGNAVYGDGARVRVQNGDVLALISKWDPITYTLVFNGNGGTCTVPNEPMTYDERFPKEIMVDEFGSPQGRHTVRDGYELRGWSQKKEPSAADEVLAIATNAAKSITVSITNNLTTVDGTNVTLYAIWKGKPQTVTIDDGHGGKKEVRMECGAEIDDPGSPDDRAGYQFAGWLTNNVVVEKFPITVPVNGITLKADWTTNEYKVAFHGTDGTYETSGTMEPQAFTYGIEQALTSNAFTRTGYTFANWTNEVGTIFADGAQVKNLATNDGEVVDLYATWTMNPRYYAVRFNPNGGEDESYVQTIECGVETALTPNRFARTGYGFAGWAAAESSGSTVVYTNGQMVTDLAAEGETNDLYAAWTPNRYWVAFDRNGADGGAMEPQEFAYDVAQALTSNSYAKTGHAFAGWAAAESSGSTVVHADGAVVSNLTAEANVTNTLWATWRANKYTVLIDGVAREMDYGSDIEKPADPVARKGYTFTGWTTNGVSVAAWPLKVPLDGLTILSAWTANAYTVRFNPGEGTGEMTDQSFTYDVPQNLAANSFTPPEMMVFDCWTNAAGDTYADCALVTNLVAEGVFDLYAVWMDAPSYAVRFNPNGGEDESYVQTIECGVETALTPNRFARTGYGFAGWAAAESSGSTVVYTNGQMVTDLAAEGETNDLYAAWTPNSYWVKFNGNTADGGEMDNQPFTYDAAQALTPNGFTKTGHTFAGWATNEMGAAVFADGAVVSNLTAEANATNTLWATWTAKSYEIAFDSAGGSAVGPMTNEYGKAVTAPTPARTGYAFAGWYEGTDPFDFTSMPARNVRLTAHWTANTYTVEFCGTGEAYAQGFTYDEPQALSANKFTPPTKMVFDHWTNAVDSTSYANCEVVSNLTAEANGVVTLYATWKEAPSYTVVFDGNGANSGLMPDLHFECGAGGALPANGFTRTGYAFGQWTNKVNDATYADSATFTEDLAPTNGTATLSAAWTPNSYWVKFDGNTADDGEMDNQPFTYDAAQALTPNGFTKTGHTFAGWATNATGAAVFADGAVVSNLTAEANATNTLWATWTAKSYEIAFDSAGGSAVGPMTNEYGKAVTAPTPARTGYAFAGWYEGTDPFDFTSMPARNVRLTAHWTANTYTVEFRGTDGTYETGGTMEPQEFTYDEAKQLSANGFTRDWHVFAGWTNGENAAAHYADGEMVSNLTAMAGGVVTLWATWTDAPSYTVRFNPNGGVGESYVQAIECDVETALTPNRFARTGYGFANWTNSTGTVYTDGAKVTDLAAEGETNDLYAAWTPNRYWVKFDGNTADDGEMDNQEFTYDAAQALSPNGFTRTGYGFTGWVTNLTGSAVFEDKATVSNLTAEANATNTLWATWTVKNYEIAFDSAGGSAVGPMTNEFGKVTSAPAEPVRTGYQFAGWYRGEVKYEFGQPMPAESFVLTARWTANGYTVEFRGTGEAYPQGFTYDKPQALEANRFTAPEWKVFDRWTNAVDSKTYADCETVCNLATGGVFVLYATWAEKPSYAVAFDGNGADGGSMATNRFECGKGGKLPENGFTRTGYAFDQWTNKVSGATYANGETFTEDLAPTNGTTTLSALWTPNKYWVKFDRNGAGDGKMDNQEFTYDAAQALSPNGFTRTGYGFTGWVTNLTGSAVFEDKATVSNLTAEANATNTLWATWRANQYKVVYHGPDGETSEQPFIYDKEDNLKDGNTFPEPKGMRFVCWTNAAGNVYAANLTVSNLTAEADGTFDLYAKWADDSYTVTFDGNEATSGVMKPQIFWHGKGEALNSNEFKRTGHEFRWWTNRTQDQEWYDKATFVAPASGEGETLYAVWTANKHKCDFVGEKKPIETSTSTTNFDYDVIVTRPNPSIEGYTFRHWTYNGTSTNLTEGASSFHMPDHDVTFQAKWTTNTYTIAFNGNGATGGTDMSPVENVKYDSEIQLPKNTFKRTGFNFNGWVTNLTVSTVFTDQATVKNLTSKDGDTVTLYAVWEEAAVSLKTALGFADDDPITVTADPADCWESADGNTINLTNDCTITFTATGKVPVTVQAMGTQGQFVFWSIGGDDDSGRYGASGSLDITTEIQPDSPLAVFKGNHDGDTSNISSLKCVHDSKQN